MNEQNQKMPYDVNIMVNELVHKNAGLTFENAELKAIIHQLEKELREVNSGTQE